MRSSLRVILLVTMAVTMAAAPPDKPSRPPEKGCKWERFSNAKLGLAAWVQRCDFGFRKIDFLAKGRSLAIHYSDGGEANAVIDVFDLRPGEESVAGVRRVFAEHSSTANTARCVLAPYREAPRRADAPRFTFIPNPKYQRLLDAKSDPNEVPDPPCGDWGDAPDGIQYFETQPGARRILFVRVGQDTPLFDEQTLRTLP